MIEALKTVLTLIIIFLFMKTLFKIEESLKKMIYSHNDLKTMVDEIEKKLKSII